jgi:iron complex outermembrane recepter protein
MTIHVSTAWLKGWLCVVLLGSLASSCRCAPNDSGSADQPSQSLKQLSIEQLGQVEVTSVTKEPEEVWKTAAAVYVITQQAIERSGVTNIPEALRLAPGVEVARIDSHTWSIGIRGFGSNLTRNILVLIDGRSVYSTLLAGTYWDVQNVPLTDIDRIEVVRGPGGTIWGPNAVDGVINIITKSSKDTQGETLQAGGGNVDQGNFTAQYGGDGGSGLTYRVYGMGFDRGPEYDSGGNNYDEWRNIQGGFRMDYDRSPRDTYTIEGDMYDEGAGYRASSINYTPPYSVILQSTAPLSGGNIVGRWQHTQAPGKDIQIEAYYDRTSRRQPDFVDLRNTFDVDFLDRFRLPYNQQISWGAEVRLSVARNPQVVPGLYFSPESRTDQLYSGFFQDEIALIPNSLSLSLGTKLLKTNYTGLQLEPSVRLLWNPTQTQTLWAAFTHAVRTPSAAERAFYLTGFVGVQPDGTPEFARFMANPNFQSEEMNGWELGYRRMIGRNLYFDLATFYNHYGNLFSEDIIGGPYLEATPPPPHLLIPAEFGNGLVGTTKGFEFAPDWNPLPFWRLTAAYSYLDMSIERGKNSLDVGTGPIVEGSSPRNQITAQSDFNITSAIDLNLAYRFVSALPALAIHSYSTGDARFGWWIEPYLQLSVAGRNLFQPYHYEYENGPGPNVAIKRSVFIQLYWRRPVSSH